MQSAPYAEEIARLVARGLRCCGDEVADRPLFKRGRRRMTLVAADHLGPRPVRRLQHQPLRERRSELVEQAEQEGVGRSTSSSTGARASSTSRKRGRNVSASTTSARAATTTNAALTASGAGAMFMTASTTTCASLHRLRVDGEVRPAFEPFLPLTPDDQGGGGDAEPRESSTSRTPRRSSITWSRATSRRASTTRCSSP